MRILYCHLWSFRSMILIGHYFVPCLNGVENCSLSLGLEDPLLRFILV